MWGKKKEQESILIVGGFHKAKSLAGSLLKKGYRVTVVNKSYEDCEKLAEISRLNVIYGDGSKKFILEDAGASKCQVAIVLTGSDELNLPKEIIIGCILRGDASLIPRGDTRIMEGDVLLIITSDKSKLENIKELA